MIFTILNKNKNKKIDWFMWAINLKNYLKIIAHRNNFFIFFYFIAPYSISSQISALEILSKNLLFFYWLRIFNANWLISNYIKWSIVVLHSNSRRKYTVLLNALSKFLRMIIIKTTHVRGSRSPFQLRFGAGHGPILVQTNLQHSQAQPYVTCTRVISLTQGFLRWSIPHISN